MFQFPREVAQGTTRSRVDGVCVVVSIPPRSGSGDYVCTGTKELHPEVSIPPRSGSGDYLDVEGRFDLQVVSIPPRSGSGDYDTEGLVELEVLFQFPREVAQGTTSRSLDRKSPDGFNSPEKWLRGLRRMISGWTVYLVSIPPRSGSGDYMHHASSIGHIMFQFPREVAQGTTVGDVIILDVEKFQFPREVAQGTTVVLRRES